MTLSLADGICSAFSSTWVGARIVDACTMITTFSVGLAFASHAGSQSISSVAWWASAHRTFSLGSVVSRGANGIGSTWVWSAQIFRNKFTAADEGITCHVSWTRADRRQPTEITISICSTSSVTWVFTDSIVTSRP